MTDNPANRQPLISARDLVCDYGKYARSRQAQSAVVGPIDFDLYAGGSIALVGESGSGKTTVARMVAGLLKSTGGSLKYKGIELSDLRGEAFLDYRRNVQVVFQDPLSSFNPRRNVERTLEEPLRKHKIVSEEELSGEVDRLLNIVHLSPKFRKRLPYEMSGGQRQRLAIARAIALRPSVLIADEPLSALDVTIQIQIIKLLHTITRQLNMSLILITHDLAIVRLLCQETKVMKGGKCLETSLTRDLFREPKTEYAKELLAARPKIDF